MLARLLRTGMMEFESDMVIKRGIRGKTLEGVHTRTRGLAVAPSPPYPTTPFALLVASLLREVIDLPILAPQPDFICPCMCYVMLSRWALATYRVTIRFTVYHPCESRKHQCSTGIPPMFHAVRIENRPSRP